MGKTLVLAEKPSVGRELAKVLNCRNKKEGSIIGAKYIVTWALGHLVTLADPEYYGEQYKKWELSTLPMLPKKMSLVVIKQTAKQFKIVKSLLSSKEVDKLVIATDAGREGELVARWIIKKAGFKKPVFRLWISSQTERAIKEGFSNLRPASEYDNLYRSAVCRAEADWVVGLNVTRALTCKYNAQLSAGRVQTPTLSMIVDREKEIRAFEPIEFYNVTAITPVFKLSLKDKKTGSGRIFNKDKALELINKLDGEKCTLTDITKTEKKEGAPLLYDLTELQRDANKKYGFSAKQTLNIMQRLYEEHKLLTYPRTDSRYLSADIIPTLSERLRSVSIGNYAPFAKTALKTKVTSKSSFINDKKVTDHHAIIPTEQYVDLSVLSADERRVYDLVVRRFLSVFLPNYTYEQTKITADIGNEIFTARGKVVKNKGWKEVYEGKTFIEDDSDDEPDDEKEQTLPSLSKGQLLTVKNLSLVTGKTRPPSRYTEATLLYAMEHPAKFVKDKALKTIISDAGGIGTPATRADIIEKLLSVGYIERRGKQLFPLDKGMQLINVVPPDLKSPTLTAEWEEQLSKISRGQQKWQDFSAKMRSYATSLVKEVIKSKAVYHHDNLSRQRCPRCDKYLLEVTTKKGKMLVCQDRDCGYRQNLVFYSNARCPKCHKKLSVTGEGEKRLYVCKCGFREKFDRFNKRLAENKNSMSKKEMRSYLKKQNTEQPSQSSFAAAWAKAMENKE